MGIKICIDTWGWLSLWDKKEKKHKDKPDISFTDLSTMIVMNELGIKQIITADNHFLIVGMNFEIFA